MSNSPVPAKSVPIRPTTAVQSGLAPWPPPKPTEQSQEAEKAKEGASAPTPAPGT